MTVAELIARLEEFPSELVVVFRQSKLPYEFETLAITEVELQPDVPYIDTDGHPQMDHEAVELA